MTSGDDPIPWATLRIELADGTETGADADADTDPDTHAVGLADRLDALGMRLAELGPVGGVETRDAGTLGGVTRPELWAYTTPDALPRVRETAEAWGARLGLRLRLSGAIRTDDDWRDEWKRFYQPQIFGDGVLLLRPSWVERRRGDPPRELVLDPGHAFGTGLHESTRLCLTWLCARASSDAAPPTTVLDLGCGSGILGLSAAVLWPQAHIVAVDVDADATSTTEINARRNGLSERLTTVTGDLAAVPRPPDRFDLVVANIRPEVLIPVATALPSRMHATTAGVLSGIFGDEVDEVVETYRRAGLEVAPPQRAGDWSSLTITTRTTSDGAHA